jgi:hypothetical protein
MRSTFTAALDWRTPQAAGLLREYADHFGPDDAATLLIHGGTAADVAPAAAALGETSPDMVLVEHVEAAELEARVDAALAGGPGQGALAGLPALARATCGRSTTCACREDGGPTASPATCAARRGSPRPAAGRATRPPARAAGRPRASVAWPT